MKYLGNTKSQVTDVLWMDKKLNDFSDTNLESKLKLQFNALGDKLHAKPQRQPKPLNHQSCSRPYSTVSLQFHRQQFTKYDLNSRLFDHFQ